MKIVADSAIPFIEGLFEPYSEVVYKSGIEICREDVSDADALIISMRTKCNAELLEGSRVKMIATANIGMDHIDLDWCREHGIFVSNAAGCNAGGVMNYVMSAIYGTASRECISLTGTTFGIIGAGSTGTRVEEAARTLGFKTLLCDPKRAEKESSYPFCSLDYLLENSDIVSLHVPLTDSTRGMADREFFGKMKEGAFFVNVSRGEVVNEQALIEAKPKLGPVVLDTWNNEPEVNTELLNLVDIATPHVAGYSLQGKAFGTAYAVRAVARYFGIPELYDFFPQLEESCKAVKIDIKDKSQGQIASLIQYNYPIFTDDFIFRMNPDGFTELRAKYKYRIEFYFG